VSDALDDAELGRLLTQLLRLVSPAAGDGAVGDGVVRDDAIPDGFVPAAAAVPAAAVPAAAVPGDAAPGAAAPADRLAGGGAADGTPSVAGIPQLSGSEARALIELVKARGIAQGELAGLLGLEKSTVSRLAVGLERKGWIRRGRDEGNQRYVRLYLTAEGGAVAARLWSAWHSRQARILAALTAEERAGLSAGLRGLVRGLAAEGLLGDAPPDQLVGRYAAAPSAR
jgi:DNA-binding MarR family transcriptional regulator